MIKQELPGSDVKVEMEWRWNTLVSDLRWASGALARHGNCDAATPELRAQLAQLLDEVADTLEAVADNDYGSGAGHGEEAALIKDLLNEEGDKRCAMTVTD